MKFSIKNFSSKCEQIRRKLQIWSHLLKKSLMENFTFCAVFESEMMQNTSQLLTCHYRDSIATYLPYKSKKTNIVLIKSNQILFKFLLSIIWACKGVIWNLWYINSFLIANCKSMDWFLYDNGLRHKRVKDFLLIS